MARGSQNNAPLTSAPPGASRRRSILPYHVSAVFPGEVYSRAPLSRTLYNILCTCIQKELILHAVSLDIYLQGICRTFNHIESK